MCTVIVRVEAGEPPHVLALRDELTSRAFDDPAFWWPEQPSVLGGRDRTGQAETGRGLPGFAFPHSSSGWVGAFR